MTFMRPALAFPYNDPDGTMLPHLQAILSDLKSHFDRAFIAPPPTTLEWLRQKGRILTDNFFTVFPVEQENELKQERENSLVETQKRLRYILPMIETLTRLSKNGRKPVGSI